MGEICTEKCKQNTKSDMACAVIGCLAEVHRYIKYILLENNYIISSAHSVDYCIMLFILQNRCKN